MKDRATFRDTYCVQNTLEDWIRATLGCGKISRAELGMDLLLSRDISPLERDPSAAVARRFRVNTKTGFKLQQSFISPRYADDQTLPSRRVPKYQSHLLSNRYLLLYLTLQPAMTS